MKQKIELRIEKLKYIRRRLKKDEDKEVINRRIEFWEGQKKLFDKVNLITYKK